jgi:hypothetical protein
MSPRKPLTNDVLRCDVRLALFCRWGGFEGAVDSSGLVWDRGGPPSYA